jgi:hypothetical protein
MGIIRPLQKVLGAAKTFFVNKAGTVSPSAFLHALGHFYERQTFVIGCLDRR